MEYYQYNDNNGDFDVNTLKSSNKLDEGTINNLKEAYISQVLPVSLILMVVCIAVTGVLIYLQNYSFPAIMVMIIAPVLALFLLARIISVLILAGKIGRREFRWTNGTITRYFLDGRSRNYHFYMAVNNTFNAMLWINKAYPKGTQVYVINMKIFTSDENVVIKL